VDEAMSVSPCREKIARDIASLLGGETHTEIHKTSWRKKRYWKITTPHHAVGVEVHGEYWIVVNGIVARSVDEALKEISRQIIRGATT
jgi:hypothetical protein